MPDPLSTFAAAGTVLQFVEIGVKLVSKAAEYRSTANGAIKEHVDVEQVASVLSNLNINLECTWTSHSANTSDAESAVRHANSECLKVSKEFLDLLNKLHLRGAKSSWKAVQFAIKTLWKRDQIVVLEKRITHARANLTLAYLVYMQAISSSELDRMTSQAHGTRAEILKKLEFASHDMRDGIAKLAADLSRLRVDGTSIQQGMDTFHRNNEDRMTILVNNMQQLLESEHIDKTSGTARLLRNSLKFEQLEERHSLVSQATDGTFGWILRPNVFNQRPEHYFPAWLALGDDRVERIFWVSGKAASGKSTLMKYLSDRFDDMSFYLEQWQQSRFLLQAHCFFWSSGSRMQKSLHGLLRSLLYQLLEGVVYQVQDFLTPQRWADAYTEGKDSILWKNDELIEVLKNLATQQRYKACIFLLIDGLDEFEGTDEERQQLVDLLKDFAKFENVKICASSRHWNIFVDAFENCLTLKVEDYTRNDIRKYIFSRFTGSRHFAKLVANEGLDPNQIITEITNKAAGVFLWVRLVVTQLLAGMRDGDDVRMVTARLDQIPSDLNKLFERMFKSIDLAYLRESSVIFQVMLHVRDCKVGRKPTLLDFSYLDPDDANFALKGDFTCSQEQEDIRITYRLHQAARRLNSRGIGLLSTNYCLSTACDLEKCAMHRNNHFLAVSFLHRTVGDFFASDQNRRELFRITDGPFAVRSFCCNTLVMKVASQLADVTCGKNNADYMTTVGLLVKHATEGGDETLTNPSALQNEVSVILQRTATKKGNTYGDGVSAEVIDTWEKYNNNLLTTSIQFGQADFVEKYLTRRTLLERQGRPFLDYALWYQASQDQDHGPSIRIVRHILELGADPNEHFKGRSVWLSFLDLVGYKIPHASIHYLGFVASVMDLMIDHKADVHSEEFRIFGERILEIVIIRMGIWNMSGPTQEAELRFAQGQSFTRIYTILAERDLSRPPERKRRRLK